VPYFSFIFALSKSRILFPFIRGLKSSFEWKTLRLNHNQSPEISCDPYFLHSFVIGPKGTKENIPTLHALEDTKLKEAHVYFQSQEGYLEEIYNSLLKTS
jgi:hypothetical protein